MENWDPMNPSKHDMAVLGHLLFVTFFALGAKGQQEALRRLTMNLKITKQFEKKYQISLKSSRHLLKFVKKYDFQMGAFL